MRVDRHAHAVASLLVLAATLAAGPRASAQDPPGCIGSGVGIDLIALVDGAPPPGGIVHQGDLVDYVVILSQPLPIGCNYFGGQLSITHPNGVVIPVAGFGPPTPDVPTIGFVPPGPFQIVCPEPYLVTVEDLEGGQFLARADYGPTVHQPGQEPGTVLTEPPTPANSATIALPVFIGEEPPGCIASATGLDLLAFADGFPVPPGGTVLPGQVVEFAVVLAQPLPTGCSYFGGQLSIELPNGIRVDVAGFGAPTPDVPIVGFSTPFEVFVSEPYVVDPADAGGGVLLTRVDYGPTVNEPGQEPGTVLSDPPAPADSATLTFPLEFGDPCGDGECCEPNPTPGCDDIECCTLICSIEPFCCEVEWEFACAEIAQFECDDTAPEIIDCPAPRFVDADGRCQGVVPDLTVELLVIDDCTPEPSLLFIQEPPPGTVLPQGVHDILLVVIDQAGNTDQCDAQLFIVDTEPPQIGCPFEIQLEAFEECTAFVPDLTGEISVSDNCGVAEVNQEPPPGAPLPVGVHEVVIEALDAEGNAAVCVVLVEVFDVEPPDVACPSKLALPPDAECVAFLPDLSGFVDAVDNCTETPALLFEQDPPPGFPAEDGTFVTVTVFDEAGNASACSILVNVDDTEPPVLECPGRFFVPSEFECLGEIPDLIRLIEAEDNCTPPDGLVVFQFPPPGTFLEVGEHPVFVLVEDEAGNAAECLVIVVIEDQQPPEILSCPPLALVELDEQCESNVPDLTTLVDAVDDCSKTLFVDQLPPPGFPVIGLGPVVVTLVVFDESGNATECETLVQPEDVTPPVIETCPTTLVLFGRGDCQDVLPDMTAGIVAFDACGFIDVVQSPPPATRLGLGEHLVTFDVFDEFGNVSTCDTLVTVVDIEPPVIEQCPSPTFVEAFDGCEGFMPFLEEQVVASDNCSGRELLVIQEPPPGVPLPPGMHPVELFVFDESGNVATCDTFVEVIDALPPEIIQCGKPQVILPSEDCVAELPDLTDDVIAKDNCSDVEIVQIPPPGATLPAGPNVVLFEVFDEAGNLALCETEVLVVDDGEPEIACPEVIIAECEGPDGTELQFEVVVVDDCDPSPTVECFALDDGGRIVGPIDPAGHPFPVGVTLVLCRATDSSGNADDCIFPVLVFDTEAPTAECPTTLVFDANDECQLVLPDLRAEIGAVDICAGSDLAITQDPEPGTIIGLGDETVTFTVTDAEGNSTSCETVVTVEPGSCEPPPGDVNGDGLVDVYDLIDVLLAWGACPEPPDPCPADVNGDGDVGVPDLVAVIANWTGGDGGGAPAQYVGPTDVGGGVAFFLNDGLLAAAEWDGLVEVDTDYVQTALATLQLTLAGPAPVDDHDLVVVAGRAALAGELVVDLLDGFVPVAGDRHVLLAAGSVVGRFQSVVLPELESGPRLRLAYEPDAVVLVARGDAPRHDLEADDERDTCVDLDADGDCDVDDLLLLLSEWGAGRSIADLDANGVVDGLDAVILLSGW